MNKFSFEIIKPDGTVTLNTLRQGSFSVTISNVDNIYYRKSISDINISGKELYDSKSEINKCCSSIPFKIFSQISERKEFYSCLMKSTGFDYDDKIKKLKSSDNETSDYYSIIYLNWKKKINMLEMPRNRIIQHKYRKIDEVDGNDFYTYPTINSERGISFIDWIYFNIKKTLELCKLDFLLPSDSYSLSKLFSETNPLTPNYNNLRNATIVHASEFVRPLGGLSTGVDFISKEYDKDLGLSFFDMMEGLKLFRIFWYIDEATGKIRLEHESFFDNGLSYDKINANAGIDLRLPKYKAISDNFDYSWKYDKKKSYGKQKIIISQNQAINNDSKSTPITSYISTDNNSTWMNGQWLESSIDYRVPIIRDFEYGNAEYNSECVLKNEIGELVPEEWSCDLFITHYIGAYLNVDSIDLTKWVLLDTERDVSIWKIRKETFNDFFGALKEYKIEKTLFDVENFYFSASIIFAIYHRHRRPFYDAIINVNETAKVKETSFTKTSISVSPTLKLNKFKIPYFEGFNPNLVNYLPDSRKFVIESAIINFNDYTIEIEALTYQNCSSYSNIIVNAPEGTLLSSTDWLQLETTFENGLPVFTWVIKKFNVYSDGFGGIYTKIE